MNAYDVPEPSDRKTGVIFRLGNEQEHEVEGPERGELAPSGHPRQQEDEAEEDEGSKRDVHQGNTRSLRWKKSTKSTS